MNISILGGGIGGLSTAIALTQAGFDVSVYERHSRPSEIGAGIVCWPNASFVLEQLGVLDNVAQVSGALNSMNRFSDTGEAIGSLNIHELNRLMKHPSYSILRKDLIKILEYIKYINNEVGNKKNNIQFLTLREDFRCTQSLRMNDNERSKLKKIRYQ